MSVPHPVNCTTRSPQNKICNVFPNFIPIIPSCYNNAFVLPGNDHADTFLPKRKEITAKTRKTKNNIFAISMAVPAIFVNPSTAAIMAITKNVTAQFNITTPLSQVDVFRCIPSA